MSERPAPKLIYWPFLLVDLLFIAVAGAILQFGHHPLETLELYALIFCIGAGAFAFLIPFRAKLKIIESEQIVSAVEKFEKIEHVAAQINSATTLWQSMNETSAKSTAAAREVAEKMTAEAQAFAEFMQKANDAEKGHLRLEVDKLKRAEGDWLQVLVYILDHVYAFQQGAQQSGQPKLVEQTTRFETACRDAVRRIGLTPFIAQPGEAFDAQKHQLIDGNGEIPAGTLVGQTVAMGYSFQGRVVRPAMISLRTAEAEKPAKPAKNESKAPRPETAELPL